jgi:RND family efflux transporter MFP subunit
MFHGPQRLIRLSLFAAFVILQSGCGEASSSSIDPAVEVRDTIVEAGAIALFEILAEEHEIYEPIVGTGTIEAYRSTDVGPLVEGVIDEVFVRVGTHVKAGDPLFRTRSDVLELRREELSFQVQLAQAEKKKASAQLARTKALRRKGVAAEGKLDDVQAFYEIAAARLGVAQSQLKRIDKSLEDCVVLAPYSGVITARAVDEGRFMTPMSMASRGGINGVLQIMQIDQVFVIIEVPERELSRIEKGTKALIFMDGVEGTFESLVEVINDFVDPETRSVQVRISLENPDYKIKPGLFAQAKLLPAPRKAIILARRAVLGGSKKQYVLVEREGKAVRRNVSIVDLDAEHVEVLDGLGAGEAVLVGPNLARVDHGMSVEVKGSTQGQRLAYEIIKG